MRMRNGAALQIQSIVEITELMLAVSEQGLQFCEDDGCLLLNGLVRECAYRIRNAAELERKAHLDHGRTDRAET